ncbi:MAG: NUDIX hydrolase [Candidatus Aquicultor sp.]|nr:NUDIX hydrolase [Candidatus Aquicultor sp.]
MKEKKFTVVESNLIYEGAIISLHVDKIRNTEGRILEREVVEHLDAVGIVALDARKNIVLVRQYRHPLKGDLLEIPAGLLADGEDPADCAIRELKEETGYKAKTIEKLAAFYTSAGFTDERFYLFFSDDLEEGEPELEPDEDDIELVLIPLEKALGMVSRGEIEDAKTLTAILMAAQKVGRIGL